MHTLLQVEQNALALLDQANELDAADGADTGFRKQVEELRKSLCKKDGESRTAI